MRAGQLRYLVTIQQNVATTTARGDRESGWQDFAEVWGDIRPLRGREYYAAQQVNAELTAEIEIRYRSDITSKMRVVYNSRVFDIIGPPVGDERKDSLILHCAERS